MTVKTSYIIITWNGRELLRDLLQSMRHQLGRPDIEVIIADNGSTDGTVEWLASTYPAVRVIALAENKGVAYARNRAMEMAQGEYLLILDNDIRITDEAVAGMEAYMDAHPETGMAGCRLVYPSGETQESCKDYPGLWTKIRHVLRPAKRTFVYAREVEEGLPFEPVYIIGACQMIRASVYREVGPLDEHIFYGPEDCDYCLRVRNHGNRVIYLPAFRMVHHCQRKTTARPFSSLGRAHIRALLYFYWKHKKL